jgi:glycosyltransferase involved in cell wall biosynthesis
MSEYPTIAVIVPTYNRAAIVKWTHGLLRSNLRYSGQIRYYIGCDGTDATPSLFNEPDTEVIQKPSGSLGANLNRLIARAQQAGIDYYLSLDDDHALMNPLGLDEHVAKLRDDTTAGWIHLLVDAVGDEANDGYKFVARLEGKHWRLEYQSPDDWPCSFRAHLSHKRFHAATGPFAEGLQSGRTEVEYNQRVKRMGIAGQLPSVLVPLCAYGFNFWAHVGQSFNKRGL